MRYLALFVLIATIMLTGCIPTTELIPDGHYTIQLTQSHNLWGQNAVHITRCLNTDKRDGFCSPQDTRQYEYSETATGPGAQLVSSVLLGASAGIPIMYGLMHQRTAQITQSIGGQTIRTSTLVAGPIPGGVAP